MFLLIPSVRYHSNAKAHTCRLIVDLDLTGSAGASLVVVGHMPVKS